MRFIVSIGMALISMIAVSCVPNVTCDPNTGTTKKEQADMVRNWTLFCYSAYNSGQLTPTAADNPIYADPAVAAAAAQRGLNNCLLGSLLFASDTANPNSCP